jgi:hypothetical protein
MIIYYSTHIWAIGISPFFSISAVFEVLGKVSGLCLITSKYPILTLNSVTLKINKLCFNVLNEHSEQAQAPHTNGPRDVPRCGALNLLQKTLHFKGG